MKVCKNCQSQFGFTYEDKKLLDRISPIIKGKKYPISDPALCPLCRDQRRLAIRNERNLYKRKSDLSGKDMISFISPDKPYKVFSFDEWWGDDWNAMDYGRDFDFNRPFFDQFHELMMDVPKMCLNQWQCENSDYVCFSDFCKNCYLISAASNCEDCLYSNLISSSRNCLDVTGCKECELAYDSVDCVGCYNIVNCIKCENSRDLSYCFDLKNCEDCIGCYNLNRKKYCIFNEQLTKEKYEKQKEKISVNKKQFLDFVRHKAIHRYAKVVNCENSSGDSLVNSKNASNCFDSSELQDCKFVHFSMNTKDSMDTIGASNKGVELCYEGMSIEGSNMAFGYYIAGHNNIYYCECVFACRDVFGCIGTKHKKYCILNKQYTKEQYEELLPRIIEHMKKTGEWGEFFPIKYSTFCYNETVASEYYPMTKDEVLDKGWAWKDEEKENKKADEKYLICKTCKKNFKIIPQEEKFYKKMNLSEPENCHNCRYTERMKMKNPRRLWNRKCTKCDKEIMTSYSPERPEIVYCEECYLKEVY